MKVRISTLSILASAVLYFFATISVFLFWGARSPISFFLHLIAIGLLVLAGLFSSKLPLFLGGLGGFYFVTLVNSLFLSWNEAGTLGAFFSNFLPINLISEGGPVSNFFFDLQLIALIAGIATHFYYSKEITIPMGGAAQSLAAPFARPIQATSINRGPVRSNTNIEGDAIAQVQKLGELRKQGLITDEEFEIKKKQILGL